MQFLNYTINCLFVLFIQLSVCLKWENICFSIILRILFIIMTHTWVAVMLSHNHRKHLVEHVSNINMVFERWCLIWSFQNDHLFFKIILKFIYISFLIMNIHFREVLRYYKNRSRCNSTSI